jgi:hypothetical protein
LIEIFYLKSSTKVYERNFEEISRLIAKVFLTKFRQNLAKLNSLSQLFRISGNNKIDFCDHPGATATAEGAKGRDVTAFKGTIRTNFKGVGGA